MMRPVELVSVDEVILSSVRADDACRAGADSLAALKKGLTARAEGPIFRVGPVALERLESAMAALGLGYKA